MYEVLNIRSLKQATPNLTVINIWGVSFVEDAHIEAFSSNCIQLAVLCVSYCPKVNKSELGRNEREHFVRFFKFSRSKEAA